MAEIAPAGGGPNRLFLIIAIGLGGLLVIGIIAVGAFFFLSSMSPKPTAAPTVAAKAVSTTTPTVRPTSTVAVTDTPAPTNTSVLAPAVSSSSGASSSAVSVVSTGLVTATGSFTGTPGAGTPGAPGSLPATGLGENLLILVGGIVLVLVIFVARRARSVGTA